jgi:hypothetical protein
VTDFKHNERMSRRQAAEPLTDAAYALVARSPVALQIDGQRLVVPDAEELLVQWDVGYADGRLQLKMEVGWPGAASSRPPTAGSTPATSAASTPRGATSSSTARRT